MRHVILISGKDSLATAIVQIEREPGLPYELIHNDTGWDLPEVLDWLNQVESFLGRKILHLGDDLTELCREHNCLPTPWRRFCTRDAKIKPLNDYLGIAESTVYFGLRADEPERVGYVVPKNQAMTAVYPLRELGLTVRNVWRLCQDRGLLPPTFHWAWMEARVRERLGADQYLLDDLQPWEKASLLAWRSRSNCDICFYVALYERIGLLEHHPERFEFGCKLEEELCHRDELTWSKGYRLRELIPRANEIKEKRAKAIVKYLRKKQIRYLWDIDDAPDELATTSCGLLCGK